MNFHTLAFLTTVSLAALPASSVAQTYVGSGFASNPATPYERVSFDFDSATGTQVESRCRVTEETVAWENIVADIGSASPTVTADFVNTITQEYVSGVASCESGTSTQAGFSFAIVNVTAGGVSGSNSVGSVLFDWSFGNDGETLSGPITIMRPAWGVELSGSAELTVQVLSAEEQLAALIEAVVSLNIQSGIGNALDQKLQNALDALDRAQAGDTASAAGILYAFIQSVEAQRGKRLSEEESNELVAAAQAIIDALSQP